MALTILHQEKSVPSGVTFGFKGYLLNGIRQVFQAFDWLQVLE